MGDEIPGPPLQDLAKYHRSRKKAGNNNGAAFGGAHRALPRPVVLLFPAFSGYGGLREVLGGGPWDLTSPTVASYRGMRDHGGLRWGDGWVVG